MAKLTPDNSLISVLPFETDCYRYHIGVWPLVIEPTTQEIGLVEDKEGKQSYVGAATSVKSANQPDKIKNMTEEEIDNFLRGLVEKWNKYLASVCDNKENSHDMEILAQAVHGKIDFDEASQQLVFLPDKTTTTDKV